MARKISGKSKNTIPKLSLKLKILEILDLCIHSPDPYRGSGAGGRIWKKNNELHSRIEGKGFSGGMGVKTGNKRIDIDKNNSMGKSDTLTLALTPEVRTSGYMRAAGKFVKERGKPVKESEIEKEGSELKYDKCVPQPNACEQKPESREVTKSSESEHGHESGLKKDRQLFEPDPTAWKQEKKVYPKKEDICEYRQKPEPDNSVPAEERKHTCIPGRNKFVWGLGKEKYRWKEEQKKQRLRKDQKKHSLQKKPVSYSSQQGLSSKMLNTVDLKNELYQRSEEPITEAVEDEYKLTILTEIPQVSKKEEIILSYCFKDGNGHLFIRAGNYSRHILIGRKVALKLKGKPRLASLKNGVLSIEIAKG